jgi:hypothetical protein
MIRVPVLAALAATALHAAPAAAAPKCEATVQIEVPGEDPVLETSTTDSTCTASGNSGPAFMIGDGGADFGTLYAHSEATFLTGETDQTFSSVAVEWRDTITVESPGLAGQVGQVHASAFLDGFIDVTGSASGALRINLVHPSGVSQLKLIECSGGGVCAGELPPRFFSEAVPVVFNVTFGEPGTFALQLTTSIGRNPISTAPGTADLDFGSTATWSGIQEVTMSGSPVPFTITAESGTDWAQPVPEPAAPALLAAGAAVLASARRFRVQRRRTPRSRRPR